MQAGIPTDTNWRISPLRGKRLPGFPLATHGAVGCTLCGMRNTLVTACVVVGNTYRKGREAPLHKLVLAFDRLRCRLDSAVYQEYPTLPHAAWVYYPVDQIAPSVSPTSLEDVCRVLAAYGLAMDRIATLLLAHYPVGLGDAASKIARELTYHATELPYTVGPPKRHRQGHPHA